MSLVFACLVLLMFPVATLACEDEPALSPRQEDLRRLFSHLEQHPGLYSRIPASALQHARASITHAIDAMSEVTLFYTLSELLSKIRDAHTFIKWTDGTSHHLSVLPFALSRSEGCWRLAACLPAYADCLGWEITAINGMPMSDCFEAGKRIVSYETDPWAAEQFSDIIRYLETLRHLGIAPRDADSVSLALRSPDGEEVSITLASAPPSAPAAALVSFGAETPTTAPVGYYQAVPLDESTLYIQYNACEEDPNLPMEAFAQSVSGMLEAGRFTKAILDLRYNSGGNSAVWYPLRDVLLDCQRASGLTVYTLIGSKTFSSGVMNALQSRQILSAVLVGTPSGGMVNCYGNTHHFRLSQFPLTVSFSTQHFTLLPGYESDSLLPDVTIERTAADIAQGIDPAVNYVLRQ